MKYVVSNSYIEGFAIGRVSIPTKSVKQGNNYYINIYFRREKSVDPGRHLQETTLE